MPEQTLTDQKETAMSQAALLAEWMCNGNTGASSKAIAGTMLGVEIKHASYPLDPGDLGRCLQLLELFPEWRPRIKEMAKYGKGWTAMADRWDELEATMRDEVGISWEKAKEAPRTYRLMREIRGAVE